MKTILLYIILFLISGLELSAQDLVIPSDPADNRNAQSINAVNIAKGRLKSTIELRYDKIANAWDSMYLIYYHYNPQKQLIKEEVLELKNPEAIAYIKHYSYDEKGRKRSLVTEGYNSQASVMISIDSIKYDINGDINFRIWFYYKIQGLAAFSGSRDNDIYDGEKLVSRMVERIDNNIWMPSQKYEFKHDNNNNITGADVYYWSTLNGVWNLRETYEEMELLNNNFKKPLKYIQKNPSGIKLYRFYASYSKDGILLNSNMEDYLNDKWENSSRTNYSFDSRNHLQYNVNEQWSGSEWNIDFGIKIDYQYNEYDDPDTEKQYLWDLTDKSFKARSWKFHTYDNTNAVAQESVSSDIQVYPNPAVGQLTISDITVKEIQLTDMLGRNIKIQKNVSGQFDISMLSEGIYCYQFISGERVFTGKVVKQ